MFNFPLQSLALVPALDPDLAAVERLIGQRPAKLAFRRLDLLAHKRRLPGVGLLLEVFSEMVDRSNRILDVLPVDQTGFQVRFRGRFRPARDHFQIVGQRLLRPSLPHQLLPFPVTGIVHFGDQHGGFPRPATGTRPGKPQH